jgi:prepilin peptidase CpaA
VAAKSSGGFLKMQLTFVLPFGALIGLATAASWTDFRSRTIPNWLIISTFVWGLGFAIWTNHWGDLLLHLLHFTAALTVGLALFGFKVWGGGDGKLYAAVAVWFEIQDFFLLVLAITTVGLALLLGYTVVHWGKLFAKSGRSIPFGVAIGLGAVLAFTRDILW